MTDETEDIVTRFRRKFERLDSVATNDSILEAAAFCTENEVADENSESFMYAVAHVAICERQDLPSETMNVSIGGISRGFVPLSVRGSDAAWWASTEFGRRYLVSVRSKKGINAVDLMRDFDE